ncbi:trypsin-like peptidase domain-containing protein [bacterium]|nr:trypsin-like peptidase domain-containing protein [bacterium]
MLLILLFCFLCCGIVFWLLRKILLNNETSNDDYEEDDEGNILEDDDNVFETCEEDKENSFDDYEEDDVEEDVSSHFSGKNILKFIILGGVLFFGFVGGIWKITENVNYSKKIDSEIPKEEPKSVPTDPSHEEPKRILTPSAPSVPPGNGKFTGDEIFEKYNSAVFIVYASNGKSARKQGSGFFVNDSCLAVSNYHVFSGTNHWTVKLSDGQIFNVSRIISQSEKDDYIVFKVNLAFRCNYIPVTNRKLRVGESVFAIGSPLGYQNTLSKGIISQFREGFIQHNASTDHGSSGGALINEYGEVIGITTAGVDKSKANLNFAKDINLLKDKINNLSY